jgi:pimeloyl-ACP methyl ester carboxylesterase
MLHPSFLDSTWLRAQWDDVRLGEGYNLIAPDFRCHGRSKNTPSGYHDTWVEAADVAFLLHVRDLLLAMVLDLRHVHRDYDYHRYMFLLLSRWPLIVR